MEKRANKRMVTERKVVIAYGDEIRSAIVSSCSISGMYVKSGASFPLDAVFNVIIPLESGVLDIPVKVMSLTDTDGYFGMGLEILKVSPEYLEFLIRTELGSYS